MTHVISDEMIEYVSILAKLKPDEQEKEQARKDLAEMLGYIDRLGELDTEGIEPMSHVYPESNRFREDTVTNGDGREQVLANAPEVRDGAFVVPRTFE
ncbi:MAG: Asp-tRNA(Asn)/Glu-tRNA(Gln) amidotransferase subunit GatC [Lachnospiraceae bacterium]|nr:Asp-tRNA(Asn)/Glu-tRNA(Gln) amidotransferase subunit GatC [Lachnospiraceae bacterium]MBO6297602.1 Asp-tRNA(Asn)/Glu-tRNA(Gln) amidotransferase subunit GatC [Lachnospiraceae bacterium]MCR5128384.1 Asp-tRNA(Asn)/Glu-tRNA(Gln) amidotransferase subunit GatC [Lachnospiraceae bacterium]